MQRITVGAAVLCVFALSACEREKTVAEVSGQCVDAYQGQVCTWATMQGDEVVELGATVPIASIENAPAEEEMVWPPVPVAVDSLPAAARQESGFTNMTMYWESGGHPPGPYLTPHFDFHFNLISSAEREAIDCADTSKPANVPAAYSLPDVPLPPPMVQLTGVSALIGLCAPKMGMHALLTKEMESSELFRGTLVIGYYHDKPIFIEPMLTREMLLERKSFTLPIPQIPGLTSAHPTAFRADYDADKQAYRFVFSGFAEN